MYFGSKFIKFKALSTKRSRSAVNIDKLALGQPKSLTKVSPDNKSPVSSLNRAKLPGVWPGTAMTLQVVPKIFVKVQGGRKEGEKLVR
jgi:hypothetical protein